MTDTKNPAVASPPDWRGLCEELVEAAEHHVSPYAGHHSAWEAAVDRAREALAQPEPEGRPAPAPAGEVGELVAWIHREGVDSGYADQWLRAADLLQRQAAPVPVAVSERLPQPEDCSAEGRCWAWRGFDPDNDDDGEFWQLIHAERLSAQLGGGWTHWLPATALPLPRGEVEHA